MKNQERCIPDGFEASIDVHIPACQLGPWGEATQGYHFSSVPTAAVARWESREPNLILFALQFSLLTKGIDESMVSGGLMKHKA